MERITDAWRNLSRREQALAVGAIAAVLLVFVALLLLRGGDEVTPVDGSTISAATAAEPLVKPTPGMIVAATVPPPSAAAPGGGVAKVEEGGGGNGASLDNLADLEAEAKRNHKPANVPTGVYVKPEVSDAIKAAGRELERVAKEYDQCVRSRADVRPCVNVIKNGVYIETDVHADGMGVTFTKKSSDGHQLDLTLMPKGQYCRVLDKGDSCDAWVAS